MTRGALVTILIAVLAMAGVVFAFITNSSPYVTVAQAKTMSSANLHLAGDIVKETLRSNSRDRRMTFDIKDEKGETISVDYRGAIPANINEAKQVVAIGGIKDGKFHSEQLLVKCPSKYEGEKKS